MEATNAILSSLIQTKSLEKVLYPISSKVSQLIIQNEAYEQGDHNAFPSDLSPSAMEVMRSSEKLVAAGSSILASTTDEKLATQMPSACESLSVAGQTLVTAAQRINIDNFSPESRNHLISCAKHVLEATLKVLLVSDDAEIRRIVKAGRCILDRLAVLTAIKHMKDLVPVFKSITDSVMLFTSMAEKRQVDLIQRPQREALVSSVTGLRKSLPMLNSAMQTYIKFPNNTQAVSGKEYAVGQVIESVNDVIASLENKQGARTMDEVEEPGHFVITIDRIIARLNGDMGEKSFDGEFDQIVEAAVRHSMAVAHLSQEQRRTIIINNCHKMLKDRSELFDLVKSLEVSPELSQAREELSQLCRTFTVHTQQLEESISDSVLQLVVCECKETSEPFERLVKAAMSLYSTELHNNVDINSSMQPYIDTFHSHADTLCQVARFMAAACPQPNKVRSVRCCVNQLEKLDPEMVPATLACRSKNSAATEHLRMIKQEWAANLELLINNIDNVIDKQAFLNTSEKQLGEFCNKCKNSIYCDINDITLVSRAVIGLGRRFVMVAQKLSGQSDVVLHRNVVTTALNNLKKALKATKSAASRLLGDTGELRYHESLHSRCDLVMILVKKVKLAIHGDVQQDIISDALSDHNEELYVNDDLEVLKEEELVRNGDVNHKHLHTKGSSSKDGVLCEKVLKTYIADLKNNRIQELGRNFVSSAVAGENFKVDLLGNDLLKWTNHICDIASSMLTCAKSLEKKLTLTDLSGSLKLSLSDMLDLSKKVLDCDIQHIEALHTANDTWTNHMSYLITYIDGLIDKWKVISDRVVEAAKMCNAQLVTGQMMKLNTHQKFVLQIVTSARSLSHGQSYGGSDSSIQDLDTTLILQDNLFELENLTVLLATQADSLSKSDSTYEKEHIEITSREWAVKVYVSMETFVVMALNAVSSVGNGDNKKIYQYSEMKQELKRLTEDTVRIKVLVENSFKSCSNQKDSTSHLSEYVDILDKLLEGIAEQLELLGAAVSTTKDIEQFYSPYNILLLKWTWVKQVNNIFGAIDVLTSEFMVLPQLLLNSTANPESLSSIIKTYQERLSTIKTNVNAVIQPCSAMDQKQRVWQLLRDLESTSSELIELARSDGKSTTGQFRCDLLLRSWGVKSKELLEVLLSMTRSDKTSLKDVEKLLKGHLDPQKHPSSLVHQVTNSQSNTNTPSSQKRTAANVQDNSISTSLLDFADDLGTTLVEFDDEDLINSPDHKNTSTDATKQRPSNTSHSYTPQIQSKSTPDPSWQQLAKGPKMQHSTPDRPKQKSGFKSNKGCQVQDSRWTAEADRWEDEHNAIVRVARETTYHVNNMAEYLKGEGTLNSRDELIDTAKVVAVNGEKLVKFARILVDYSADKRCASDLHSYCMNIPTVIAQLHILSRVKEASSRDEDDSAERMLLKTAQNLVAAINRMLNAAEAVCVKGLRQPPPQALDETEAVILATQWKRRFNQYRRVESSNTNRDALGLRKVSHINPAPALAQIMQQR